jgi:hypothetical protein
MVLMFNGSNSVSFSEKLDRESEGNPERKLVICCIPNEGPTLSLGGRGVFIQRKKTPTSGLWSRHTVGKDPSFFHGVT